MGDFYPRSGFIQGAKRLGEPLGENNSEDGGFEPPVPCGTHRFQRCAIDHSANLPNSKVNNTQTHQTINTNKAKLVTDYQNYRIYRYNILSFINQQ